MKRLPNKTSAKQPEQPEFKITFGDFEWLTPVFKEIRSFLKTASDAVRFLDFIQEILCKDMLLAEIVQSKSLHEGILRYHFEQIGFIGATVDLLSRRVVLLRIEGELFAVQLATETKKKEYAPVLEISGFADSAVLQVLDCKTFLNFWSKATGNAPENYDTESSIQPYLHSLIKGELLDMHGKSLRVESILGQGLEGTVLRVRDMQTGKPFALKVTYKDLRGLFDYWSNGLEKIRSQVPEMLLYLCEFYSCELAGKNGSTLLMQYVPLKSLQLLDSGNRLTKGLRILTDVISCVRTLHRAGVCHGDMGVSNVFIRQQADGCDRAIVIDPHPDACSDFEAHQRKDKFGIAHILYWIVTGEQWPEGTYPYLLRFMRNDHDQVEGAKIFSDLTLKKQDKDYSNLHTAAIQCLCNPNHYEAMVEKIVMICRRLNESSTVTIAHSKNAITTSVDVERRIANALKPIGSGIFMPLFSLPSYFGKRKPGQREYGLGDCGPAAREFVQLLKSMGQKFWLLLPISPTDQSNCPYRTDSSFALHLNIISPEDLLADRWITRRELDRALPAVGDTSRVPLENETVFTYKRELLALAFKRRLNENKASWQRLYESFLQQESDWVGQYAVYKTIEACYPTRWTQWPEALRDADPAALEQFAQKHAEAIEQEKFCQFLAQHYFLQLRRFAEEHEVYLIGDMPAYSMHGSADVWAHRSAFELAENGERTLVAGAPPDVFDAEGQGWNHPMYRWNDDSTLQFLRKKYVRMKQLFANGFVRDDHIIGKVTPWGYTFGQPAAQGHRVTGTFLGNSLFDVVLETIPDLQTFLIGEDLGILTIETRRFMRHYGFMGMKVLQFIPFNEGSAAIAENLYTPGNYSEANVVLLGTHDAPLIRQWWREELNDTGRQHFAEYLRKHFKIEGPVTDDNVAAQFTELAMKQSGQMVIHQVPDLIVNKDGSIGLTDARMNDPSSHQDDSKNWSWRLQPGTFERQAIENLRRLTELTNRTPAWSILRLKPCWPGDDIVLLSLAILQNNGGHSKALAKQLESILSKGLVRYAPLGADCLSAIYSHSDGSRYLLLSPDCTTLEQKTLSLIRGLEAYMQQENPNRKTPLKKFEESALAEAARSTVARMDRSVRDFVILSSNALHEEMVAFIGSLLNPDETTDRAIRKRLKSLNVSTDERRMLAKEFLPVWTDLWITYEQREKSRRSTIAGILTGELHGTKVSLRELRWRLAKAYTTELSVADKMLKQWKQLVASWAESLDLDTVSCCLFGIPDQPFNHSLDAYGKAEGLSGLLGLIRKARRKEQKTTHHFDRFRDYALGLILASDQKKFRSKTMARLLVDTNDEGSLELLLELAEHSLIKRLGALKPRRSSVTSEFPAEIDTQIHSYHSDCGGQSVARIVFEAYDRGLKTIAITDHQCFDGIEQALEIGELLGVHVIPAIELYTGIRRRGQVEQRRDVLVYFPDVPHFSDWWKQGLDAETWQLFNDGWNRKVNGSEWGDVPIRRVTNWAYAHGGVPVLAHPGLWSSESFHENDWSFDAFEQLFLETGLAGIEISHSRLPFEENTKRFVPLIEQFNQKYADRPIVFTMGTDSHTPEGIGRANLTEEAVAYIAQAFFLEGPAAPAVRTKIVDSLQNAAERIMKVTPLYQLRDAVLRDEYAGFQAYDKPLAVRRTDKDQPSETILAGIKDYKGQPVIVAINIGQREQFAGKDWGSLNLAETLTLQNAPEAVYRFKDLITGKHYERTGTELFNNGLHVGLFPNEVQFLLLL